MLDSSLLTDSWVALLDSQLSADYFFKINHLINYQQQSGYNIFPAAENVFLALNTTAFADIKVVILGQDPYPSPGHAHGLAFSVPKQSALPKSLQNIFKELKTDLGIENHNGNLLPWAEQGVLLLNSVLTVQQGRPASHANIGWELFTDFIIELINEQKQGIVFLLWGSYAQKKGHKIDRDRHLVIESPHPSPLSAYRGFYGSKPFSKTNAYLQAQGKMPINWQL